MEVFTPVETFIYMEILELNVMESTNGRRRALLTNRERELIADESEEDPRYVAISRVRNKIQDELPEDVELLREHHPGLFEELRDAVCKDHE